MKFIQKLPLILGLAFLAPGPFTSSIAAANNTDDKPIRIQLKIHPQAPHRMALKHELLPPYDDLRLEGNAALAYYIVIVSTDQEHVKTVIEEIDTLLKSPTPSQHLGEIEKKLEMYQGKIRDLKRAARYRQCNWQAHWEDGFETLLPFLAPVKRLSFLVLQQAQVDIMKGDFDAAIECLQTGMAMGQHCIDQTLVNGLVCLAITKRCLMVLENYVQAKDAPNLYQALSALPRPLVDFRAAMRFERASHDDLLMPELRQVQIDLEQGKEPRIPMQKIVRFVTRVLGTDPMQVHRDASQSTRDEALQTARSYLAKQGFPSDVTANLMPLEIVFLASFDRFHYLSDKVFKNKAKEEIDEVNSQLDNWLGNLFPENVEGYDPFPFQKLFPALGNVKKRKAQTERDIDAWRCIEAIRAHAAANEGNLPGSLESIQILPIPLNTITGQAFGYQLTGKTAILTVGSSPNESKYLARDTTIYELTVD
ncbi:hypothetical protein N9B94_01945 [Verrucomicrobia bacterium]|nr:hypothetical protein [Verrucomicrobiota bacterium]